MHPLRQPLRGDATQPIWRLSQHTVCVCVPWVPLRVLPLRGRLALEFKREGLAPTLGEAFRIRLNPLFGWAVNCCVLQSTCLAPTTPSAQMAKPSTRSHVR